MPSLSSCLPYHEELLGVKGESSEGDIFACILHAYISYMSI